MRTIGSRLQSAIDAWPPKGKRRGIRQFQREMEERAESDPGLQGVTYPSIDSYLKDRNTPSLPFVEAAAEILGVRAAWLAFGEEPRTPLQELLADEPSGDRPSFFAWMREDADALFTGLFDGELPSWFLSVVGWGAIHIAASFPNADGQAPRVAADERLRTCLRSVLLLIAAPFLRPGSRRDLTEKEYLLHMCATLQTLLTLTPAPGMSSVPFEVFEEQTEFEFARMVEHD